MENSNSKKNDDSNNIPHLIPNTYVSTSNQYDKSSYQFAIIGFVFPLIGLILYFAWNNSSPKRAKSCAKGAITGVIASILAVIAYCIIGMFLFD